MIQIQNANQFTKAAERLQREHMGVRRHEPHMYEVTNKTKDSQYHVRITRQGGAVFGSCTCPAGLRHGRHPLVCKHLAAVVIFLGGIQQMRRGN
jgi:phage portal protein BeeE